MNRPLLAFAGLMLAGTTAVGVYVASPGGGEEEVVQQVATPTPPACVPLDSIDPGSPCLSPDEVAKICAPQPNCGPPMPAYTCIYAVVGDSASCIPLDDPRVTNWESCKPIEYKAQAACLPAGATHSGTMDWSYVYRGVSIVRWGYGGLVYDLSPEDEADFAGLKTIFDPPPPCRWVVAVEGAACMSIGESLVKDCPTIRFEGRSACLPPGATVSVIDENYPGVVEPGDGTYIKRSDSVIHYIDGIVVDELIDYSVAQEDQVDFAGLGELFKSAP